MMVTDSVPLPAEDDTIAEASAEAGTLVFSPSFLYPIFTIIFYAIFRINGSQRRRATYVCGHLKTDFNSRPKGISPRRVENVERT